MIKHVLGTTLFVLCGVSSAVAEPCVSATFDVPLPGAIDVVTRHADVPSPQFPGLWQEGRLEGYFYTLYANGEAVLKSRRNAPAWEFKVVCDAEQVDCSISVNGLPPDDAKPLADVLALCLQGRPLIAEEPQQAEPEAPCGLATVEDGPEGMVLQRLLVAAGADPGPVDGFVGNGTRKAIAEILGESSRGLAIDDAIVALDLLMCE